MRFRRRDFNTLYSDHENSDYALTIGPALAKKAINYVCTRETASDLSRFDQISGVLLELIQDPKRDDGHEMAGYTGHRTVQMESTVDHQYALGFYMQHWKTGGELIIIAHWRRIYPDDDVRLDRESGEARFMRTHHTYGKDIDRSRKMISQLETLYEKFIQSHSYEAALDTQTASY